MKSRHNIFLFLLVILLAWNRPGKADSLSAFKTSEIHPVDESRSSSAYPGSQSQIFGINHPGESAVNLLNRLPKPNSIHESQNDTFEKHIIESIIQRHASIYLFIAKQIDRGLTVKKLIFPFHSFL